MLSSSGSLKHLIDLAHPVLPQLADLLGDQTLGEIELAAADFDHLGLPLAPWPVVAFASCLSSLQCAQEPLAVARRDCCPQVPGSAARRDGRS